MYQVALGRGLHYMPLSPPPPPSPLPPSPPPPNLRPFLHLLLTPSFPPPPLGEQWQNGGRHKSPNTSPNSSNSSSFPLAPNPGAEGRVLLCRAMASEGRSQIGRRSAVFRVIQRRSDGADYCPLVAALYIPPNISARAEGVTASSEPRGRLHPGGEGGGADTTTATTGQPTGLSDALPLFL